jgi:predicted transcriptional regulator of viral defense system
MTYLGATYYVGWLAAAALYGAAHHAPQVTHIATSKMIRERQVGRTRLVFHERSRISELPTVSRMARAGAYRISSPEVTAFDVASDLAISGGLDNVVTVLVDLADETGLDDQTLAKLAARYPDAAVRRIGWIVEEFTVHRLDALAAYVSGLSPTSSRLHPSLAFNGDLDARWNIRLNTTVAVE